LYKDVHGFRLGFILATELPFTVLMSHIALAPEFLNQEKSVLHISQPSQHISLSLLSMHPKNL
jgi:hypothetical protein